MKGGIFNKILLSSFNNLKIKKMKHSLIEQVTKEHQKIRIDDEEVKIHSSAYIPESRSLSEDLDDLTLRDRSISEHKLDSVEGNHQELINMGGFS